MHYELARPEGSYFRWEKVKTRLDILNEVYFKKINKRKKIISKYRMIGIIVLI